MPLDIFSKLTIADQHSVHAYVAVVTAVDAATATCTIDPNDTGGPVDGVAYVSGTPAVNDVVMVLHFDGALVAIAGGGSSGGGGLTSVKTGNGISGTGTTADPVVALTSNTWGAEWLAKTGNDPNAGRGIYIDSRGQLRARPTELDAVQGSSFTANSTPSDWPVGQMVLQVTGATAATWPGAVSGMVVTIRRAGEADPSAADHQWFYRTANSLSGYQIWYRAGSGTPATWGPWVQLVGDSGWVNITINSGFVADNVIPQARLKNGIVYVKGGFANTGISAINTLYTPGNIPAGYRPVNNVVGRWGTSSGLASAALFITATGDIQVRTGPNLSSYYLFGGQSWPID